MLKFDNIFIGLNYDSLDIAKTKHDPIMIEDENDSDEPIISLTLDQARWLRDNINYIIKKFED